MVSSYHIHTRWHPDNGTEAVPTCGRCAKAGVQCLYQDTLTPGQASLASSQSNRHTSLQLTPQLHCMAVVSAQADLQSMLSLKDASSDGSRHNPSTIGMLHHFQSVVSSALGCTRTNNAMQSFVTSTAWYHPYLMHMVLAVSILFTKAVLSAEF